MLKFTFTDADMPLTEVLAAGLLPPLGEIRPNAQMRSRRPRSCTPVLVQILRLFAVR